MVYLWIPKVLVGDDLIVVASARRAALLLDDLHRAWNWNLILMTKYLLICRQSYTRQLIHIGTQYMDVSYVGLP